MLNQVYLILPECILLVTASLILIVDTMLKDGKRLVTYWLSQLTILSVLIATIFTYAGEEVYVFNHAYIIDHMSVVLKVIVCFLMFFVLHYSHEYLNELNWHKGEYYILGLFAILGMMIMSSAASILTLYLGLELMSLSLYAMVALHRDSKQATEAAMKYFILGALASGMLLYGISLLYGLTGSLSIATITSQASNVESIYLLFAIIFIIIGLAFKLGVAPFHMWLPDVYQGAPSCVTLFIASAPKIAAFAMTTRILFDGLVEVGESWKHVLAVLAVLSLAIGNITAIAQINIKRMLAYSTIAHMGYLLLGIIAANAAGFSASMFYINSYALMTTAAFGMIILLSHKDLEAEKLEDFKGLAERNPWFAFMMLCIMFSMAGVPPFVGFWAKWYVLKELVAVGFVTLAAIAVIFSIIGAYYYLRIVKLMYFDKADSLLAVKASKSMRFLLSINALLIVLLGLFPNELMQVCKAAFGV